MRVIRKKVMDYLLMVYTLKAGSVQEPKIYLGADVKKVSIGNDRSAWGISSDSYVASAVREVERKLKEVGKKLPTGKCTNPMSSGYRAELDASPELNPEQANYFQSLIGALRWAVELGQIDIIVEVNMLLRYLVSPRVGHLKKALHIFTYLKQKGSCTMVFDPTGKLARYTSGFTITIKTLVITMNICRLHCLNIIVVVWSLDIQFFVNNFNIVPSGSTI